MWKVISAELNYNRWIFAAILLLTAGYLVFLFNHPDSSSDFLLGMFAFLVANSILGSMTSEKRINRYVQLPLPELSIAISRIILIILPFFCILSIYLIIIIMFVPGRISETPPVFVFSGVFLIILSLMILIKDLLARFSSGDESTQNIRMMAIISIGLGVFALLGVFLFLSGDLRQKAVPVFRIIEYFFSIQGIAVLYVISGIILGSTLYSYSGRKSFIE